MKAILFVSTCVLLFCGYFLALPLSLTHHAIDSRLFYLPAAKLLHTPLHDALESYLEFWNTDGGCVECFAY